MVLLDDLDDAWIELMLHREIHAILHVRGDDQRAHRRRQRVMRVLTLIVLILDKIAGFLEFADVVKIGTNPTHRGVGSDSLRGGFRQRCDHQAVVKRSRCLKLHFLEQFVVQIAEFQPADIRRQMEHSFENRKQPADQHGGGESRDEGDHRANSQHLEPADGIRTENRHHLQFPQHQGQRDHHDTDINACP